MGRKHEWPWFSMEQLVSGRHRRQVAEGQTQATFQHQRGKLSLYITPLQAFVSIAHSYSHAARHVEDLGEGAHALALALEQGGKHHRRRNHNHGAHDGVEQVAVELPARTQGR